MPSEKTKSFLREVLLIVLGGGLAVAGSLISSNLSTKNEKLLWETTTKINLNQKVMDQRVKLIERTALILNKVDYISVNYIAYGIDLSYGEKGVGKSSEWIKTRKIISDLNSEFLAVSTLNSMYFGPKTNAALKNIMDATTEELNWWDVDPKLRQDYLEAIHSEFSYGLY
ncbi:hypothetical protein [Pseudoalteromonas sp. BDTF-M6]|uniref:hypothetical protein n=1 Tax=Pseudoalteromonas sp. BDTF-M6 TaxID=2796132 RepID=UPI001BAE6471|nr:hypothetical protein [Pseudoalteromonas sp. BDTF-M6]MBS3799256.1 hypothetical protein [Pseudoalteromonas sp. BDTF-M6]